MFVEPAVPPERARLLDARGRARRSSRRRSSWCVVAPRSAKLVEARGARFTLLCGYVVPACSAFLTMLLLWNEGIVVLADRGSRTSSSASASGLAGTPASHSLTGSVPVTRAGMASGTADLQRDLGGAIMQSIFGALLTAGLRGVGLVADRRAPDKQRHRRDAGCAHEVVRERRGGGRSSIRSTRTQIIAGAKQVVPRTATTGPTRPGVVAILLGAVLVFFMFPKHDEEKRLLALPRDRLEELRQRDAAALPQRMSLERRVPASPVRAGEPVDRSARRRRARLAARLRVDGLRRGRRPEHPLAVLGERPLRPFSPRSWPRASGSWDSSSRSAC